MKNFNEKETAVVKYIIRSFLDLIEGSVEMFKGNREKIGIMLSLICIDVISKWSEIYELEENKANKKRFYKWVDDFIYTHENPIYSENEKEFKSTITKEVVWKLRNSLVHFYGLPVKINNRRLGIFNKKFENSDPLLKILKENHVNILNFTIFFNAIKEGIKLFGEKIAKNSLNKSPKHIKGILKMYEIYQDEGGEILKEKTHKQQK